MARRFDFGSMRDALRAMPKSGVRSTSVIGSNVAGIGTLHRDVIADQFFKLAKKGAIV